MWPLPAFASDMPEGDKKYATFASALFKGKVIRQLKVPTDKMTLSIDSMLRTQSQGSSQVKDILHALTSKDIATRASLKKEWKKNPSFLKKQMQSWVQGSFLSAFDSMWSGVVNTPRV